MRHGITIAVVMLGILLAPLAADAGQLVLGNPNVAGSTVSVPVVLSGDVGRGASSITFKLTYDPNVFEPVGVTAGAAASAADKSVHYNMVEPGHCNVLMMGLNTTEIPGGEVATLKFRRLTTGGGSTELGINELSLSDGNAGTIPSQGGAQVIDFSGDTPTTKPPEGDTTTGNGTETPTPGAATPTPATQPGTPEVAKPGAPVTAPATGQQAAQAQANGQNVLPGVMAVGGKKPLTGDPKDPAFKKRLQQMVRMGDLSQLPSGVQPGAAGSAPGTPPATAGTVNAQSGTQPETPGTPGAQTKTSVDGSKPAAGGVGALAMNTSGGPGQVGTPAAKKALPAAAAPVSAGSGGLKWVGVACIALALGVLFMLRRRLFS